MAGRRERLVPGDLRAGDAGAVHALEQQRVAAFVDDADGLQYTDFLGLLHRRRHHVAGFPQFELDCLFHREILNNRG
ncbi:hypothetical protein D3C86_1905540 [compost metagenome]